MAKNVYERLAEHLDKLPGGFPPSPSAVELRLLKRLFTPKEAKLAMHLTLNREEAGIIARRAKIGIGEAEQRLREMARKGLIFSVETEGAPALYQAVPWVVGIYEFQVNNPDDSFFRDVNEYVSTKSKVSRPQPIPQMRTIPIARSIEPHLEALPYERAEELINTHKKFAVAPCICRRKAEKIAVGCDAPKETCLIFGEWADYYVRNGIARYIDQSEVSNILTMADKANLVLQPNNSRELVVMCCCCGCCCAILTRIKSHPRPSELVASPFRARHEPESCAGCGTCIDRCQMDALIFEGGRVVLNSHRCIGCGLCVSTCPTRSLTLERKPASEQIKAPISMDATWRELSQL
jgi:electron transport complex protein RnfB